MVMKRQDKINVKVYASACSLKSYLSVLTIQAVSKGYHSDRLSSIHKYRGFNHSQGNVHPLLTRADGVRPL